MSYGNKIPDIIGMNEELIDGLVEQVREELFDEQLNYYDITDEFCYRFLKLIVQSIADIDFRHELGVTSDQCFDIRNLIKNHFKDEQ